MTSKDELRANIVLMGITPDGIGYVTEAQAAQILDIHRETLRRWRCEDPQHFPYRRIGARARYSLDDLLLIANRNK